VLTGTVQPRVGHTPYVRFGNWPVLVIAFAGLALGFAWPHRRSGPVR
jgi:apolipoprotein N-acyltransferase